MNEQMKGTIYTMAMMIGSTTDETTATMDLVCESDPSLAAFFELFNDLLDQIQAEDSQDEED